MPVISVVGCGKLGFSLAVVLARSGYKTIGVDVLDRTVDYINAGKNPITESDIQEHLAKLVKRGSLRATKSFKDAIMKSDVTFITVNTPQGVDGSFDLDQVKTATYSIAQVLKDKKKYHTIVLSSTVLPETTEKVMRPILENVAGRQVGDGYGIVSNPHFIALGTIVRDILDAPFVIVGSSDKKSGGVIEAIYRKSCRKNPAIIRTSLTGAEFLKFAFNAYATTKINFINNVAKIAAKIDGGDANIVSKFFRMEEFQHSKYLQMGWGFGGPCFPKDLKAFIKFSNDLGLEPTLFKAVFSSNLALIDDVIYNLEEKLGSLKDMPIAILGTAYKPNVDIIENSLAIKLIEHLASKGSRLSVYDPMANDNTKNALGSADIKFETSVEKCIAGARVCIISTAWEEFKKVLPQVFKKNMASDPIVYDCWRIFDADKMSQHVRYLGLGLRDKPMQFIVRTAHSKSRGKK